MTHTSRLIVDSWAWLELLSGSDKGRTVEAKLAEASELLITILSLAEVVSVSDRRHQPAKKAAEVIMSSSKVFVPSREDAIEAGLLHAEQKTSRANFSLADAFVLQAARKLGAKVLTGDPDFRGVKDAVLL